MLQKLVGQVQFHMHVVMLEAKVFNSVKQWFYLHLLYSDEIPIHSFLLLRRIQL